MTASTVIIAAQFALLIAILIVLLRRDRGASDELTRRIAEIQTLTARLEPTLREELKSSRVEMADQGQQARTEVSAESRSLREELLRTVNIFGERVTELSRTRGTSKRKPPIICASRYKERWSRLEESSAREANSSAKVFTSDLPK